MKILKFGIHTYVRKDIVDKLLKAYKSLERSLPFDLLDALNNGNYLDDIIAAIADIENEE